MARGLVEKTNTLSLKVNDKGPVMGTLPRDPGFSSPAGRNVGRRGWARDRLRLHVSREHFLGESEAFSHFSKGLWSKKA